MFEKNLKIGVLLDFYGDILSERKRAVLDDYYNADMSLSEIADEIGISRQGVRELIQKTGDELLLYEEKLGYATKLRAARELSDSLLASLRASENAEDVLSLAVRLNEALRS